MYKFKIKLFLIISILGIVSVGLFNYIIDPFEQYRKMTIVPMKYGRGRYVMPGMLKLYKYNSLIVGSSMTQNFNNSDVKNILGFVNPIKLTIGGAGDYELKNLMDIAFKYQKIKQVLYCIETGGFAGSVDEEFGGKGSTPLYLYDNNYLNDYKYLLNMDNFIYSLGLAIMPYLSKSYLKNPQLQYDTMFQWQQNHINDFHKQNVIDGYNSAIKDKKAGMAIAKKSKFEILKRNFNINFLPRIKKYKDVEFILFYPPRPIIRYVTMNKFGYLDDALEFKKYIFNTLSKYKNVKIYDFNIARDITYNISLYKDTSHYTKKINKWILEQIKLDNYRITNKNLDSSLRLEKEQVNIFNKTDYFKQTGIYTLEHTNRK